MFKVIGFGYDFHSSINPFHANPLAVVWGMGGGGFCPPPLISQPLVGLEGCFLVRCASIKDLSIVKRMQKISQKIRPIGRQKCFRGIFFALISGKNYFENRSKSQALDGKNASEAFFGLNFTKKLFLQFKVIKKLK